MSPRPLPPLTALRAFEAAARHESLSAAARELNVTHAAIAQQVRRLEAWTGTRLLAREGRGVAPTSRGRVFAQGLGEGFGVIGDAVATLMREDETRPIRITLTPTIAMHWLMPRIGRFREQAPEVELMVNPSIAVVDLAAEDYDVAFRYGRGRWPGLEAERMVASDIVLVASEALIAAHGIETPQDLVRVPWVQELESDEVRLSLAQHGVEGAEVRSVLHLPGHLAIEALRAGQGVGFNARAWLADDIRSGRLSVLFEEEADPELGYYVVTRPGPQRPALRRFLGWVRREIAADTEALGEVSPR